MGDVLNDPVATELDELLPQVRARDHEAFRRLYELIADPLASFAYGMLRDRGAAEDAVQQAFLELTRAAADIDGDGASLRAWMYRSVRFRALDEIRRRRRRPETPVDILPDDAGASDPDPFDAAFDPAVERALESLTEQQREVLLLRHVAGLSGAETARVLGTNRAAVYAAASRAEASMKKTLQVVESVGVAASVPVSDEEDGDEMSSAGRRQAS